MRPGDVLPFQIFEQFDVVVAGHGDRASRLHHVHDQPQHVGVLLSPVAEIAEKSRLPPLRMGVYPLRFYIAEFLKEHFQLVAAAVNVADDVEGTVFLPLVVPEFRADDLGGFRLFRGIEDKDKTKALPFQTPDAPPHLPAVLPDDPIGKISVGTGFVALRKQLFGHVENDRHGVDVLLPREIDDLFPRALLDVGRVDDGQFSVGQALARRVEQEVEGVARNALIVFVVADHPPEKVGGQHLRGLEMPLGKTALSRRGRADQRDEAQFGNLYPVSVRLIHFS